MRWALILAAAALVSSRSPAARADAVAFTCSTPKNVEAIVDRGACVGFVAKDANGKVVQRVDKLAPLSGSILATPDGKTIAMLQDFPYTDRPFATLPALVFFRDGKVTATYTTTDLVQRMQLVTHSVSHVRWVQKHGAPSLVLDKTFALTTTSQRAYMFDTATGGRTAADDTDDWKTCDLIVYAAQKVPELPGGVFTIAEPRFAKGQASKPLVLRANAGVQVRSGATMCVTRSAAGFVAIRNIDVMFNALPAAP